MRFLFAFTLGVTAALSACEGCIPDSAAETVTVSSEHTSVDITLAPFGFALRNGDDVVKSTAAGSPGCAPLMIALRADVDINDWHRPETPRGDEVWSSSTTAELVADEPATLAVSFDGDESLKATVIVRVTNDAFVDVEASFNTDEANIAYIGACFGLDDDEHLVGGGERFPGADLRGHIVPLSFQVPGPLASASNEAHVPVPFYASTAGYAVLVDSERVGAFDVGVSQPGRTIARFHGASLTLALRAGALLENVAAHARRMGLPPPPPRWALAPMQWRNELAVELDDEGGVLVSGTDKLLADAAELRARNIPTSTLWIDAPWETGYNTFQFNEAQLPSIHDAIAALEADGFHVITWATEHVNNSDDSDQAFGMPQFGARALFLEYEGAGFLVRDLDNETYELPWERGRGGFLDFTNPLACASWQDDMRLLLESGVRGFKLDFGESMRADLLGVAENTIPQFSDGSTPAVLHTRYARLYHECYLGALDHTWSTDRFVITRSGGIYDQRNGVAVWPGDLDSGFQRAGVEENGELLAGGVPAALFGYLSLAMSGYPLYGSDIGGSDVPTPEAFARWSQVGALSTIMQVGGGNENRAPWDAELVSVVDIYQTSARLHMDLLPMWEEWTRRASSLGEPVAVPVGAFANAPEAWADEATFVLGGVLLAAPVIVDGERERKLFVPAGSWSSWWDDAVLQGPGLVTVEAPLDVVPLFLNNDGIVVLSDPRLLTALDNGTAPGGYDDMGARRVVRASLGGAAQAIVGDVVVIRSRTNSLVHLDIISDTSRPLVADLRGTSLAPRIVGRDDAIMVATEDDLLACTDVCLLVEAGRVRATVTGRELSVEVTAP